MYIPVLLFTSRIFNIFFMCYFCICHSFGISDWTLHSSPCCISHVLHTDKHTVTSAESLIICIELYLFIPVMFRFSLWHLPFEATPPPYFNCRQASSSIHLCDFNSHHKSERWCVVLELLYL